MKFKIYFMIFLSAFLSGCYSIYKNPTGSNIATLSLNNASEETVYPVAFKNGHDCSGGKQPFDESQEILPGEVLSINVEAGKQFSYFVTYKSGNDLWGKECLVPVSFLPKQGYNYYSTFSVIHSKNKCTLNLKIQTANGLINDSSFIERQWKTPLTESGSFCADVIGNGLVD